MKKILLGMLGLLLVCGCGQSKPEATPTPQEETTPTPVPTAEPTENTEDLITNYTNSMEEYELLRYGFLGTMNSERSLEDVIERASTFDGLAFVKELKPEDCYYGEQGEENNVYLLVPKKDVFIQVGKYSWNAGEIVESYHDEQDGKPFLFIETAEYAKPISAVAIDTPTGIMNMFTGFNVGSNMLRTDFLMGVVDITPYEKFNSSEVPFYSQAIFDIMQSVPEIMDIEKNGGTVSVSNEEIFYEDEIYAHIYARDKDGNDVYYGISPVTGSVIKTIDHVDWEVIK